MRTLLATLSLLLTACAGPIDGTHAEIVDKGGQKVYVAGAAGPGINKQIACGHAVSRSVGAIALKFAQEEDDIADEVADMVGVDDGRVFLERYAKAAALDGALQDLQFDPVKHLCMATVSWTPPVFIKEAISKYAEKLKKAELAEAEGGGGSSPAAQSAPAPAAEPTPMRSNTPPPPPTSVAPPPAATAKPAPIAACGSENKKLDKVIGAAKKTVDELQECLRRTSNDETTCHRYKLYVEDAQKKEAEAGRSLSSCLNRSLSSKVQMALNQELPGHAAVAVETRGDGTLILWTFSPVEQTAFALEVDSGGRSAGKSPLAANQVQWVREQLGL